MPSKDNGNHLLWSLLHHLRTQSVSGLIVNLRSLSHLSSDRTRCSGASAVMSAYGYKQKVVATPLRVRCPPESRRLQPGANVCWLTQGGRSDWPMV